MKSYLDYAIHARFQLDEASARGLAALALALSPARTFSAASEIALHSPNSMPSEEVENQKQR